MKLNPSLVKSTIVAALGGLLFGFDTAVISGTTAALTQNYQLSPKLLGITVASALWGTVIGSLLAGFPGEWIGRRDSLRVMAILYLISGLGCAAAWSWPSLVGGVTAIPAALFFLMLFGIPRSPRWLAKKGHITEARGVLQMIGEENFEQELQEIVESIRVEQQQAGEALFTRTHLFPIFLAVSVAMFNQLAGINAILYYLNDIFAHAGFSKVSGNLQAVAVGGTNLLFTILAMSVIDRIGRKTLLLIGSIGTAVCLAGVAIIFFTAQHQGFLLWLLIGYIAFFAFSQGAVIWVYLSEVFPNNVRAKGQSLGSFTHWIMNALISGTFPLMAASSGGYPFIFFSLMMIVQFFVVLFVYPETKGITLEEMQKKLALSQAH